MRKVILLRKKPSFIARTVALVSRCQARPRSNLKSRLGSSTFNITKLQANDNDFKMLSRRLATSASRQTQLLRAQIAIPRASFTQSHRTRATAEAIDDDPNMNGGYQNPPRQKREDRDPYGKYWDQQERRNFGEPVHEDNDILGRFSPHAYRHFSSGRGLVLWAGFLSCLAALSGAVYVTYPDRPSYPKEFTDGLEKELGGTGSLRARKSGDPTPYQ